MQLNGYLTDWITSIENAAVSFGQWVGSQVSAKIAQWNSDVQNLRDAINQVQMSEGSTPDLANTRAALLDEGNSLLDKVAWIQQKLNDAAAAVGLNGLGILPAVVPAVIVAAIVAATVLIYQFINKVSAYLAEERRVKAAIASGQTPYQATVSAQQATQSSSIFSDISGALVPLAIIAGAAYVLRGKL